MDPDRLTVAVLAGGEGTRMGVPKALLHVGGRPILEYLLERLAWPGPTLLVTAPRREHPPGWSHFTAGEVVDPVAGLGPLRGLLTALDASATPVTVVCTVDMPGVGQEQVRWLVGALLERPDAHGVACHRRREGDTTTVIEPFPCALRPTAAAAVRAALAARRRAVHGVLASDGFVMLTAPTAWGPSVWVNLNTPGELAGSDVTL